MLFDFKDSVGQKYHDSVHSPHGMVVKRVPKKSRVLDLGCGVGHVAQELGKRGCSVWGIEGDPAAAKLAEGHCVEVAVADLDTITRLPYETQTFDVVLLLDILEHLKRPDLFLPLVVPRLSLHGILWISLPNIARAECRWNLLRGIFDYRDGGILSKGHLRFFTRKTARELIKTSGLEIISEQGTGFASRLNSMGMRLFQEWTAFQFLFECQASQDQTGKQ